MVSLSYKQYFIIICFVPILILVLIVSIGIKGLFVDKIFGHQIIYSYQLDKIAESVDIETLFVGDSSLGNSINSELFTEISGRKSINISLTGLYGYAGSYNMIKKSITPATKNIVLMQTLDTLKRDVSYAGYLMTLNNLDDLKELNKNERNHLLSSFFELVTSMANLKRIIRSYFKMEKESNKIENDYIKQKSPIKLNNFQGFSTKINKDKIRFLKKIIAYCNKRRINLVYVHGPIHQTIGQRSEKYITKANKYLHLLNDSDQAFKLKLVTDVILIAPPDIGDSNDHVHPQEKSQYTEKFFQLIQEYLY